MTNATTNGTTYAEKWATLKATLESGDVKSLANAFVAKATTHGLKAKKTDAQTDDKLNTRALDIKLKGQYSIFYEDLSSASLLGAYQALDDLQSGNTITRLITQNIDGENKRVRVEVDTTNPQDCYNYVWTTAEQYGRRELVNLTRDSRRGSSGDCANTEDGATLFDTVFDPLSSLDRIDNAEDIITAIKDADVSNSAKATALSYYVGGLSLEQIAKQDGIAIGSLRNHLTAVHRDITEHYKYLGGGEIEVRTTKSR